MTKTPTREIPYGAGSVVQRGERWQARWFDETGTRRSRMFDSADEANDYLRDRFRARRDGRSLTPSNLTVADLIADWLDRGKDDWRPTSWAGNRHVAETRVIPAIGHIRADMLDPPQVQRWIDGMRRDKRSAHWIDRCLRVISGAYRQAIQIGIVRTNPVDGTKRPTVRKPDIVTWAATDVAVIDAALADEPLWQAVYRMALTTGMRPGELRALRWSDIDMTESTVHIRRTMTRDAEDRPIVGNQTKTGRDRTVTLAASAKAALERWRPAQEKLQEAARRWDQAGYVFTTMYGGPLSATTWQQRHKRLVEQTGVPYITLHGLRHSFATIAMERNIHMRIVAEILGHSNVQTTLDRYSHPSSAMQQQASKALDSVLFGQVGTTPDTKA